jgi:hypothetical protein
MNPLLLIIPAGIALYYFFGSASKAVNKVDASMSQVTGHHYDSVNQVWIMDVNWVDSRSGSRYTSTVSIPGVYNVPPTSEEIISAINQTANTQASMEL